MCNNSFFWLFFWTTTWIFHLTTESEGSGTFGWQGNTLTRCCSPAHSSPRANRLDYSTECCNFPALTDTFFTGNPKFRDKIPPRMTFIAAERTAAVWQPERRLRSVLLLKWNALRRPGMWRPAAHFLSPILIFEWEGRCLLTHFTPASAACFCHRRLHFLFLTVWGSSSTQQIRQRTEVLISSLCAGWTEDSSFLVSWIFLF